MGTARFVDWIHRKRQGGELSDAEIKQMIEEYVSGQIPAYQMAAMLMAIYFQGMNDRELTTLTLVMRDSGFSNPGYHCGQTFYRRGRR